MMDGMNITWYGHRCVRIEAKEGTVLVDPFDPKAVGLRGPSVNDDIVLVSEPDPGKAVLERISDSSFVVRGPGEYERKGIAVRGIQGFADSQQGKELGLATIYCIVAEDISICHLGALGQAALTDEQIEAIGDPDVLIIPVGGQSALDAKVAAEMCNAIEPKIIVPVQFTSPDKFVKEVGLTPAKSATLRINKKLLPVDQTQLCILES
jgi:L-ascorbate metabolism protein UlaG (beta-lactamase superfamily)